MIQLQKDHEILSFKLVLYCCVGSKNEEWEFNHLSEYQYILLTGQNSYHFLLTYNFKKKVDVFFKSPGDILNKVTSIISYLNKYHRIHRPAPA